MLRAAQTLVRFAAFTLVAAPVWLAVLFAGPSQDVHASSPTLDGQACAFTAPDATYSFGHIGWGIERDSNGDYTFGATENRGGVPYISPGKPNGAWHLDGNFDQMLAKFRTQDNNPPRAHYTEYRCKKVASADVSAAGHQVATLAGRGYAVFGNNCIDHLILVLGAYGAGMQPAWPYMTPVNYFYSGLNNSGFGPPQKL